MKHIIEHQLGVEKARTVLESALTSYKEKFAKYNPSASWTSPTRAKIGFSIKGVGIDGTLDVLERQIELDLDVPFLLRPFRGKAIEVIEREVKKWIAKAEAGGGAA